MAELWLTEEERQERASHLTYLKTTRRDEIAEMLKIARGFGDLSENAEYDAAKNEQAQNEYDIVQLEDELRSAKIFDHKSVDNSIVNIGSFVSFRNIDNGMHMSYQIVGSTAADPRNGKISNESPIGAALLGKRVGDRADAETPGGIMHFEIVNIGK